MSPVRISGFLPDIQKPEDLPIGTAVKVVGFDDRGIVLKSCKSFLAYYEKKFLKI